MNQEQINKKVTEILSYLEGIDNATAFAILKTAESCLNQISVIRKLNPQDQVPFCGLSDNSIR
jgi:hypothetical protein